MPFFKEWLELFPQKERTYEKTFVFSHALFLWKKTKKRCVIVIQKYHKIPENRGVFIKNYLYKEKFDAIIALLRYENVK